MNWPPLEQMMSWENAFVHLCDPSDPDYELRDHGEIFCGAKDRAIAAIYPAAVSTMFAFDLVAGILLDCVGTKITCLLGLAAQIVGWILIACSGPNFNGYMAGFVVYAMGIDPAFFGVLPIGNLFPGWSSTVMAILGAARSGAFANSLIMKIIVESNRGRISLRGCALVFAGILGLWFLYAMVFIPFQPYPKLAPGVKLDTEPGAEKQSYKQYLRRRPTRSKATFVAEAKSQWIGFRRYATTLPYIALCILPILVFTRNAYYGASYNQHLYDVVDFFSIMNPLSFIPCPFLGLMADYISAALTILLLGIAGLLSMVFVQIGGTAMQYISVCFNWIFISFIASQFYVYVAYCYPQRQMGKLAGVVVLVGAMVSLVATPMYDYASINDRFTAMNIVVMLMSGLSILLACYLYFSWELPIRRRFNNAKEALRDSQLAAEEEPAAKQ